MEGTTFVGLDAHKEWINVAMLLPGRETPIEWQVPNEAGAIRKMLRRIEGEAPGEVRFCYEAGPCGYALQRQITALSEASCMVVAPSLIPGKPGERVKTDRRDAKKLAFLFRAGMLTEVQPPSEEDEAARDLCRAREDAREDLVRCRHRLTKFLLRRGIVFREGKRAWTRAHRHHQDGKWSRTAAAHRGRVELPAPTPRGNASAAQEGTTAKGDRTRRSRHAAPLPPIRPIDTPGRPPTEGHRGGRT